MANIPDFALNFVEKQLKNVKNRQKSSIFSLKMGLFLGHFWGKTPAKRPLGGYF